MVIKRSIAINGHSTSITLEKPFWDSLKEISEQRGMTLRALVETIDRENEGNLSSALRVFILNFYKHG
jgi:predicted DNA-binding ribbon-helix-helix protein